MNRDTFTSRDGALWVQPEGPNTKPYYLGCHDVENISEPGSGIGEIVRCFDQNTGKRKIIGQTKTAPDTVTTTIETPMGKTADWLERIKCPVTFYVNVRDCGRADTFDNYVRSFILQNAEIGDRGVSDVTNRGADNASMMSFDISATPPLVRIYESSVERVTTARMYAFNDIAFTEDIRCAGACGAFQDAGETGYVVSDALGGFPADVLKTIDGGETWAATAADPFAAAEDISSVVLFYMGRDTLRVLVARGTTDAGAPAEVAYSDDGGATWTLANVGSTNAQYATRGGSLFALDQYNIWFASTGGYLYKSEDGGVTWTAKQTGVLTTGNYNAIHFASEKVGFAGAAADVIVKTTNGGDTWTACTATGGGGDILTVWALDEYRVWVGTDDGDVFFSNDGGMTWTERTISGITAGTIADIQFANDMIGFFIHNTSGPVGRIYRTINGGYSWQAQELVTNAGLNAISVIGDRYIVTVGEVVFVGAYDNISSIVAGFSVRRLLTSHTSSLLRIRRSSDNAESDIDAAADGYLDMTAAATFIGAGSGYGQTVYDQSGNANNVSQTTASLQPLYTNDSDGVRLYHDRVNDALTITSLAAGTYTVGLATWSAAQVFVHKQNATGAYSLNPADFYDYVIIDDASLDAGETAALQTALQTSRPAVNSADVLRLWSSSTSVNLAVTQVGDAGLTWEAGDGQTGSGTTFVKTLGAAPDWVILRATDKSKITQIDWNTKNLFGQFGDLSALTALTMLRFFDNQLTGSIPPLSALTALTSLRCDSNQLTGAIPPLSALTALTVLSCYSNQLTGSIPPLLALAALASFNCFTNQLTGYIGGGVSATLGQFRAENNLLTEAAVDAILADFVAAGRTSASGTCVLNIGGTGNATPSAAGLADKATLQGRGWTVTTN